MEIETVRITYIDDRGRDVGPRDKNLERIRVSVYGIGIYSGSAHIEFLAREDQHRLSGLLIDLAHRVSDTGTFSPNDKQGE